MCSVIDRFFGACGYMPPTTRFFVLSAMVALLLGAALRIRN